MSESFELDDWEERRGDFQRQTVPDSIRQKSFPIANVVTVIIITAALGAILFYMHNGNTEMESAINSIKSEIGALNESTRADSAKIIVRLLTQKYFQNLEHKMYSMQNVGELEQFHEPERMRILKEFQEAIPFPQNSPLFVSLKSELETELDKVYRGLENNSEEWNVTISKAYQQVQKVYSEEFKRAIKEYNGNDLLSPEISFEFHEKISQIAISKCVRQKLVPTSTRILLESKFLLDQAYNKKIADHAVIGIDFGYNEARVAIYFQGKIQVIPHLDRSGEVYNATACYVGVSTYDGCGAMCKNILETSLQLSPIIYYLKYIKYSWDGSTQSEVNLLQKLLKLNLSLNFFLALMTFV